MLVLCVQEWAALGPQSMPTNNLSLTLGQGREEEAETEEEEEDETESTRTKCPAQGRERTRDGQSRGQKDEGVKKGRDQDPEENTVSSLSFRSITLNIFLW